MDGAVNLLHRNSSIRNDLTESELFMLTATATTFWDRLDACTAPYDLLKHPFYQAWTAGELTRDDLAAYASEYWHHVSAFPTYLSALHSRLPDGELRREVLRNLTDEEGVDTANGRAHSELWMDFATGMGATTRAGDRMRAAARDPGSDCGISRDDGAGAGGCDGGAVCV